MAARTFVFSSFEPKEKETICPIYLSFVGEF